LSAPLRDILAAPVTSKNRWQIGVNYNYYTGAPVTISAQNSVNAFTNTDYGYTPDIVGPLPTPEVIRTGGYVGYFSGLTQINDPSRANITTVGGLNTHSTLLAIANASGLPILVNPLPGQLGNLGLQAITLPPGNQLDLDLQKTFRISERFNFLFRATATNALNHPEFNSLATTAVNNLNINSTNFGHFLGDVGPRILVLQARLNF
jgi:hypothetical protein